MMGYEGDPNTTCTGQSVDGFSVSIAFNMILLLLLAVIITLVILHWMKKHRKPSPQHSRLGVIYKPRNLEERLSVNTCVSNIQPRPPCTNSNLSPANTCQTALESDYLQPSPRPSPNRMSCREREPIPGPYNNNTYSGLPSGIPPGSPEETQTLIHKPGSPVAGGSGVAGQINEDEDEDNDINESIYDEIDAMARHK